MTLLDEARRALAQWGGSGTPRLISHRENAVFDVRIRGARAALRLHRPGYRTSDEIASELMWADALARAGLPVPQAVPMPDGQLVWSPPGAHQVSVTSWIDGHPIGAADQPLDGDTAQLHHALGALLARLHQASDDWQPPADFTRPAWDALALVGPDPAWGRYWTHPDLSAAEREVILEARAQAADLLADAALDTGLIHADALRENVFQTPNGLTLIDFDDSGVGYRLYDLAGALSQSLESPDLQTCATALVAGYRTVRPLPEARHLMVFSMLRAFSSLGWVIPRLAPGDPKHRVYLTRAVRAARAVSANAPLYRIE